MSKESYIVIKTREGLAPGLKTLYYVWSGENPPDDLSSLKPVREDISPWINYVWWDSPKPGVPAEFYAIAWLGYIRIDRRGLYRIYVTTDDGSRVWIDGKLLIDAWKDQPPTTYISEPIFLKEGFHRLKYYFYTRYAFSEAVLGWIPPNGEAGPIPKNNLYHAISDKVFFIGLPDNYVVEAVTQDLRIKRCVFSNNICMMKIGFEETPLEAIIRIIDPDGITVFKSKKTITLWGGDELEIREIKE